MQEWGLPNVRVKRVAYELQFLVLPDPTPPIMAIWGLPPAPLSEKTDVLIGLEVSSYFAHGQSNFSRESRSRGTRVSTLVYVAFSRKTRKFGKTGNKTFHLLATVLPVLFEKIRTSVPMARYKSLEDFFRHFRFTTVFRDESHPCSSMSILAKELHTSQRGCHVFAILIRQFGGLFREGKRSANG